MITYQKNQNLIYFKHFTAPQQQQNYMKQEITLSNLQMQQETVETVQNEKVMDTQFTKIYRQALQFSNCKLDQQLKYRNVLIYNDQHIHQIYSCSQQKLPHLVLLHGFGGTGLTFVRLFQNLKDKFHLHALDTYGIGLSSRGEWKDYFNAEQTVSYYIEAIQQWRKKVKIQQFFLLGHSFGGYLSVFYLQKYPEKVKQLVLVSPVGSCRLSQEELQHLAQNRRFFNCIASMVFSIGIKPSSLVNIWGFGGLFISRVLNKRLKLQGQQRDLWTQYLKRLSSIRSSSQPGFYKLFTWPLQPYKSIQQIIIGLQPSIPIDFLYGEDDWMNQKGAIRLAKQYRNINHFIVQKAGHQIIFDNPVQLSRKVLQIIQV